MDTYDTAAVDLYADESSIERAERLAWEESECLKALEMVKAGYYVTFEEVKAWVDSIGTDHELPPPDASVCRPL